MKLNLETKKFYWTRHAQDKMSYYRLSQSRVKRIFRHPQRVEAGVAENTTAAMQGAGSKSHPYEVWIMYQIQEEIIKIISAWRYPGVTKSGDKVPIPPDILEELGIK